jgi:NADH:ubiquinone oxidoreductase subunit 6 (subunit J)
MAIQVLRDPRPYLLVVIPLALIVVVPLMFGFITMMDRPFGDAESETAAIVRWALLGVVCAGLLVGLMVILARATRLSESEHKTADDDAHRAS